MDESAVSIATWMMKTKKQLSRTAVQRNAKAMLLRSGKSIGQNMKTHRLAWAIIALGNLWLLSMLFFTHGPLAVLTAAAFGTVLLITLRRMFLIIGHPGRTVQNWAVEEQKHQHIKTLTGKTTEELETMLQYHMEQGNMEEADRISLSLLAMAEGNPQDASSLPVQMEPNNPDGTSPANGALPSWMTTEKEPEPETESQNLPDWMRKN